MDEKHTEQQNMEEFEDDLTFESAEAKVDSPEEANPQADSDVLQQRIDELERANAELANQFMRLKADFDNYKRRTRIQMEEIKAQAASEVMKDLLPVLDDFERALKSAEQTDKAEAIAEGVDMVFKKLMHTLGAHGLERIDAQGQPFDAELHEAISVIGDTDGQLHVINELQTGYMLNGRVIRHTKVQVGELKGD